MSADEVWSELAKQRAIWKSEPSGDVQDFKVTLRGGQWTLAVRGLVSDGVRAYACGQNAIQFCTIYGTHKSATFSQELYGHEEAHKLAQCWAHRMQFWLNLWIERGMFIGTKFVASDDSLYGRFEAACELQDSTSEPVKRRLSSVLSIHPKFDSE